VVDVSPPQEIGHRTGILYFCISIGVLTGSPIAGALVDANNGEYTYLKLFAGVTMLSGAALVGVLCHYMRFVVDLVKPGPESVEGPTVKETIGRPDDHSSPRGLEANRTLDNAEDTKMRQ
jgi:hypothetical protein